MHISWDLHAVQCPASKKVRLYVVFKPFSSFTITITFFLRNLSIFFFLQTCTPSEYSLCNNAFLVLKFYLKKTKRSADSKHALYTFSLTFVFPRCCTQHFVVNFYQLGFLFHLMSSYTSDFFRCCQTIYSQNAFLVDFDKFDCFKIGIGLVSMS